MKYFYSLIAILLLFVLLTPPLFAQSVISLSDSISEYRIGQQSQILLDVTHHLTIDSVAFGTASKLFVQSHSKGTNFGHTTAVVWVRFAIRNTSRQNFNWYVTPDYSLIDKVSLFVPSTEGTFTEIKSGIAYPMSEHKVQNRLVVLPFQLNAMEQKTIYMRFESDYSLPIFLKIWDPSAFTSHDANINMVFGLFYGALFIMAFYNLFLFFSIGDLSYLYYCLFVLSLGWYQSIIDGLSFQFLSPNNAWINTHVISGSVGLSALFGILFVREFLQIKKYSNSLDNFYKVIIVLELVFALIVIPYSPHLGAVASAPTWMGSIVINIATAIYCFRKGNKNTRIYLIATLFFLVGSFLRTFRVLGIEERSFLTESGMQIGILIEMTLLSFALGNRIKDIRQTEEHEKGLIRLRIASDLHDEIGSNLSSISVASQMVAKNTRLEASEKRMIDEITATAKETAESFREIIWFVNPEHDSDTDLLSKMEDTAAKLLQGIEYSFTKDECLMMEFRDLQFRRNFFLVFKEILHNIVKHSKASRVDIKLRDSLEEFRLTIADNGIGFDEKTVPSAHGDGIKNLKKRIDTIGGSLQIKSQVGKGTSVNLIIKR